ncbi:MgtC/SapB transporter [Natrialba magadii ATCC 43099]|uniref:MgtC/SapB transporter n=1 Tax=Natrialba magadii (strain ATCC 43099 / DSM 3394 / CCM 3739 / CIP 104546 / IAM 13178 / JCM 8861 / NBRC 102185 / NCIMB 2190 / MS3) TaxID=547559 RepID=L9V4S0_NATMM|nr:MgtC/SapB family protein [Natrialba magadii]ELY32007.1 MgtC/SapB transporter [Natrialba magadii ATCC 43099]
MNEVALQIGDAPLDETVVRIALAGALGMFLGLEREWSQKSAGIRTFSLISLLAAVFTILVLETDVGEGLLVLGGLLVIVQGVLLAVQGLLGDEDAGLSLTTSVSMLVAYGVGSLVAAGFIIEGVTVAVLSSLLLVLKRELHEFAWGLTREEMRSTTEFAILAFVIYPLLPAEAALDLGAVTIPLEPQVIWLMVVAVAGIGIVNYAIVSTYGGRGIAVTGFFGGLASSTAVVGTMLDHVRQRPEAASYAVAAILLANAAMAARNLAIAVGFTMGTESGILFEAILPLGAVIVIAFAIAGLTADWRESGSMELESPFSMKNALAFGAVFLVVLVFGSLAETWFGTLGFYATAVASGFVSSAGATTSAVVLYRGGQLSAPEATIAILLATVSSIVVKAMLAATSMNKSFRNQIAVYSVLLLLGGAAAVLVIVV